jgi:hypothetical protein
MLIAEIHGKRFPEAEGQEDWLTSAVFGHLRHISPGAFWTNLFDRAHTVGTHVSLCSWICAGGIQLTEYEKLQVHFWKSFTNYGEPDLVLCFSGGQQPPLIVVIEVKLDSSKSGTGENDQLKRYLELLEDPAPLREFPATARELRCLVYLTRAFSKMEIEESVHLARAAGIDDADNRLFGLQWQDVLESAAAVASHNVLLEEVTQFLKIRGFEAFRGFKTPPLVLISVSGTFYGAGYFRSAIEEIGELRGGRFYGN